MSSSSKRREQPARRRVLILINDVAAGGAQRAAIDQARGLDPDRFEVELASLELVDDHGWAEGRLGHVPLNRLARPAHWPKAWTALDRVLASLRPDLLHAHLAAAGLAGTLAARLRGVPRVLTTFHNLTDWEEKRRHPLRVAARQAFRACDRLVAVSQAVRSAIAAVSPRLADRTEVVHNGVDLERFRHLAQRRGAERARLGFGPADLVVGAVARLDVRKGLDVLVEAAALARNAVPELRLLLVGEGSEREGLEVAVRSLGIADRVHFAGACADPGPFLAAMDVFAAPSRTEGQGIAVVEALASGLPVLASSVGGIPEIVSEGVCGRLLPADHPPRWAAAMVELAQRPDERRRLASAAPAGAAPYSIEASVEKIERLYGELLEEPDGEKAEHGAEEAMPRRAPA